MDGTISIYNWDSLIDSLSVDETDRLALTCALVRGDFFYRNDWSLVFQDPDIKSIILDKFERISNNHIELGNNDLSWCLIVEQDNPFTELPTDIEIYNNNIYALTDDGLLRAAILDDEKTAIEKNINKLWDCPLYSISAKNNRLALSGGEQGLFECNISLHNEDLFSFEPLHGEIPKKVEKGIYQIGKSHSSFSSWSSASIYSSSYVGSGYMCAFGRKKTNQPSQINKPNQKMERIYKKNIFQSSIFGDSEGLSWGLDDKIYRATPSGLEVVRFIQSSISKGGKKAFERLEMIPFQERKGKIIGGGVALFGAIVEWENALFVLQSDGDIYNIEGPVTGWRVFPRSERYENHLHVIYEDCMKIFSFNHDYFVQQNKKIAGVSYSKKHYSTKKSV
jgi:hypothetical protein